ncbi:MAG TPA: hypothetical protein DEV93_14675 [Chloroflexi bacterium]|nr:hypothetical protein [Chloroflexota bacterium]
MLEDLCSPGGVVNELLQSHIVKATETVASAGVVETDGSYAVSGESSGKHNFFSIVAYELGEEGWANYDSCVTLLLVRRHADEEIAPRRMDPFAPLMDLKWNLHRRTSVKRPAYLSHGAPKPNSSTHSLIDIWAIDISRAPPEATCIAEVLPQDEQNHAISLTLDTVRREWVVARAALRIILGKLVGTPPRDLRFQSRPCSGCGAVHGKPYLVGPGQGLNFNVSHSGRFVLIGITFGFEIGVDIERIDLEADVAELADTALTSEERDRILAFSGRSRAEAFIRHWVLKEAFLKGIGVGLTVSPSAVSVSASERRGLFSISAPGLTDRAWVAVDVPIDREYVAAVAAPIPNVLTRLLPFEWPVEVDPIDSRSG